MAANERELLGSQSADSSIQSERELEYFQSFSAKKLSTPKTVDLSEEAKQWKAELDLDVTQLDESTWKLWLTTEVVEGIGDSRLYGVSTEGNWEQIDRVAVSKPTYVRAEKTKKGTTFSLLSEDDDALNSTASLLRNLYYPTRDAGVSSFRRNNGSLPVQAARTFEEESGTDTRTDFGLKPTLAGLARRNPSARVLDYSMAIDIPQPPLMVRILSINQMGKDVYFSASSALPMNPENESTIVNSAFGVANKIYQGERVQGKK